MPVETFNNLFSLPPTVVVSRPAEEGSSRSKRPAPLSRRYTDPHPPTLFHKEQGHSTEWSDIEDSPPDRRRSQKQSSRRHEERSRSEERQHSARRNSGRDLGRFFPSLTGIVEAHEYILNSGGPDSKSHRGRRKRPPRDERGGSGRRDRYRVESKSKRTERALKRNPSLLSVSSGMTGGSKGSGGSGSTITQQSYDRRRVQIARQKAAYGQAVVELEVDTAKASKLPSELPNVFDFMETESVHDHGPLASPSPSSEYELSDVGSSEAPETPSSRSTFPSPTLTRNQSLTQEHLKSDHDNVSNGSIRSDSRSPDPSGRSLRKQPSVSDIPEDEETAEAPAAPFEKKPRNGSRSSSQSTRSIRGSDRVKQQVESMHQHMAHTQQPHFVEPVYGQQRSFSNSSIHSDHSAYAHFMAMQQHQWPLPAPEPPLIQPQPMNGHISPSERPPAPDVLDLSQRTLTGYEQLALELATSSSPVQPVYRKFEYLNHRVLLHLQDEICELEEQLRTLDEIIARADSSSPESQQKRPSSRRLDAFNALHGSEIHRRRTDLLGRVFQKTDQYNRAMSGYAALARDSSPAGLERITAYREWMQKHAPLHESETRFLQHESDLIVPNLAVPSSAQQTAKQHAALAYLPVVLMLPLLLYSLVPSLTGRLLVTLLIAIGAFIVAATTRVRELMAAREWAVCGGAYVLLMAAIAGCVPQYG